MNFQSVFESYKSTIDALLVEIPEGRGPRALYDPVRYVLEADGKRIRGVLAMIAATAVGGDAPTAAIAGAAVEILHNFTLVHDDIMDRSPTRRGRDTVHVRWNEPTAILTGDVMIGLAYQALIQQQHPQLSGMLSALTSGLTDVCEGQALDIELATRLEAGMEDYLRMIAMKTGRLLETAAELGGFAGNGSQQQIEALCSYARHLGLAFQIQDDLLDITAEEELLGKPIGGDVMEGKRTFLVVRAMECVTDAAERHLLDHMLASNGLEAEQVPEVRQIFHRNGVLESAQKEIEYYTDCAKKELALLPDNAGREMLVWFAEMVMERKR